MCSDGAAKSLSTFISTGATYKKRRHHKNCEKNAEYIVANNHLVVDANDLSAAANFDPDEPVPPLHVFFDIESMQVEGRHVPNLIVAKTEMDDFFERYGNYCIQSFFQWLDSLTNNGKQPLKVVAHNFWGYDSYPVIAELHRQKRQLEQVRNGGKVFQLTYNNEGATVRFIDSLSFFTMPLSAFPKTFGLREPKKGFFPHLLNMPDNQTYHDPLPAAEYVVRTLVDRKRHLLLACGYRLVEI